MYPWLFILCIVLGAYMFIIGHMWTHKHDNKIYEFKNVVLKYNIASNPRGPAMNYYSIAEVMPNGTIRYFSSREDMRKGDDIYEGKLLIADMIQEKGQTDTLFSIDRKSIRVAKLREMKSGLNGKSFSLESISDIAINPKNHNIKLENACRIESQKGIT